MAKIVFNPGLSWGNLPPSRAVQLVNLADVSTSLDQLRAEWQEATGNLDRVDNVNLASLFDDLHCILRGRHESTG